ncbi:hypothetical protein H6H03_12150 [Nostoc paludosum FACHB-159]|uniref:Uncharacterized protein n=1 Tax=Nostoc paludosum FACHB-159 TaxID=2692908 RepID=A0ABR8K764_9NOSO|nr:hypothetical protein [Nostoc paludosum]MBD2734654.1 hypothetical protein [Nostoc paludosum FACHB-159]
MESLLQVNRNIYMHFFSCFSIHVPNSKIDEPTKVEMAIPEKHHLRNEQRDKEKHSQEKSNPALGWL